ncbi:MAG: hypothetical protein ACI8YQ_001894 [Polaribacter sp.]|jgi:hypothetical protein
MIIYNVTVKIKKLLEEEWIAWMKETHIPDILNTGLFSKYQFCRLLHDDEDGGRSFAIQFFCKNMDDFQKYQKEHAPALQKEHMERYDGQYVAFRTLMELVD